MLSAIGNYIYDRRRGLLKSAGIMGTMYVAGKYIIQRLEEVKEAVLTDRNAKENLRRRFQQNMQDCTYTIMAYMPTLASRILEELDVERISLELQRRSKKPIPIKKDETNPTEDDSSSRGNSTHLSASLISAGELEASSPISSFSNLSENNVAKSDANDSAVPSSSGQQVSEGQNTSSFLSGMQSTEPLSSSLPLSSATSPLEEHKNPMADSATSWLQLNPEASTKSGSDADDEGKKQEAKLDTMPVIPDLEPPTVDLAALSISDTQSGLDARPSDTFGSQTEDIPDGQGSLQRKTKAELWHELKIMSFTRVLVVLYSTTLLSLQIHVQLNLIGRHKYVQSVLEMDEQERAQEKERQREEAKFDSMGLVGSLVSSVAPALSSSFGMGFSSLHSDDEQVVPALDIDQSVDEDIERKYLTLSWWLLHIGWRDIAVRVRSVVEDVLEGVSLKTHLSMQDVRALVLQIRKQVEFEANGQTRTDITSAIFPLSPSAEQNVLIQGGISPHLATIDPPLRRLLDETKEYVAGPDFQLVWGLALDKGCDMVLDGLEREIFGEHSGVEEVDPAVQTLSADKTERLAGILPGLARWCHPALYGLPNELVEALGNMREVAGLSAILYSSYNESTTL